MRVHEAFLRATRSNFASSKASIRERHFGRAIELPLGRASTYRTTTDRGLYLVSLDHMYSHAYSRLTHFVALHMKKAVVSPWPSLSCPQHWHVFWRDTAVSWVDSSLEHIPMIASNSFDSRQSGQMQNRREHQYSRAAGCVVGYCACGAGGAGAAADECPPRILTSWRSSQ